MSCSGTGRKMLFRSQKGFIKRQKRLHREQVPLAKMIRHPQASLMLRGRNRSSRTPKVGRDHMDGIRRETDSLGVVNVPADKLWGAQTQRSLEHFSIGRDLIPREMVTAYATLKKAV